MPSTGQPPPPKVNVTVEINTMVEISDDGYLGETASVQDHMNKAVAEVKGWQWYVNKMQGTRPDPQPIGVRLKIIAITILPKENE